MVDDDDDLGGMGYLLMYSSRHSQAGVIRASVHMIYSAASLEKM
jgi:hypothetical protein